MKEIEYKLLIKFLKLFIKEADLPEDKETVLFDTLKIINENKDIIERVDE